MIPRGTVLRSSMRPGVELAKIRALDLPPQDEALVLGGNFLRLISRRGRQPRPYPAPAVARAPTRRNTAIHGSCIISHLDNAIPRHASGEPGAFVGRGPSRPAGGRPIANCRSRHRPRYAWPYRLRFG